MQDMAMPPFPWQSDKWHRIYDMIANQRLPHALLISGMAGIGIEDFAKALSRYLLCHTPLEDIACGRCKACNLIAADTHPDFFLLTREGDADKKSDQIKIDQVRNCVEFVVKTAHFDARKVVLIDEADRLNTAAANALLKSLEEPQGNTVFILVTTRPNALLPTIKSRCQLVPFSQPNKDASLKWLQEHKVTQAEYLLDLANGAPLTAKLWFDTNFIEEYQQVCETLHGLLSGTHSSSAAASRFGGIEFTKLLHIHSLVLESAIKVRFQSGDHSDPLFTTLAKVDVRYLFKLRDSLQAKIAQGQSFANVNETLLVEELSMDWFALRSTFARVRVGS